MSHPKRQKLSPCVEVRQGFSRDLGELEQDETRISITPEPEVCYGGVRDFFPLPFT